MVQNFIYFSSVTVFAIGLFTILISNNYIKKIIGLSVLQSSVLLFYIALSKIKHGAPPINQCFGQKTCSVLYTSPISHVLMLTAIVVGFATVSLAMALIYQINTEFHSISEETLHHHD